MLEHVEAIICKDQCITTTEMALLLKINKGSINTTINALGYSKMYA